MVYYKNAIRTATVYLDNKEMQDPCHRSVLVEQTKRKNVRFILYGYSYKSLVRSCTPSSSAWQRVCSEHTPRHQAILPIPNIAWRRYTRFDFLSRYRYRNIYNMISHESGGSIGLRRVYGLELVLMVISEGIYRSVRLLP